MNPSEFIPWKLKASMWVGVGLACYFLAQPLYDLSRAVEGLVVEMEKDCVVPGTIPEKPKGPGTWRLTWERVKR